MFQTIYTLSVVTLSVSLFHVPTTEHIFSLWWLYEQEPTLMFSVTAGKCVPFIQEGEKLFFLQPSGRTQLAYHHIQYTQLPCLFFSQKHFSITLKMCCPILNNTIHFSPKVGLGIMMPVPIPVTVRMITVPILDLIPVCFCVCQRGR